MADAADNDITIKIGADTVSLTKGLDEASSAVSFFGAKTTALVAALAATPAVWRAAGAAASAAGTGISAVGAALATMGVSVAAVASQLGTMTTAVAGTVAAFGAAYPALGAVSVAAATMASNFTLANTAALAVTATLSPMAALARGLGIAFTGVSAAAAAFFAALGSVLRRLALFYAAFQALSYVIGKFNEESRRLADVGAISTALSTSIDHANQLTRAFERVGISTATFRQQINVLKGNIEMGLDDPLNRVTLLMRAMGIATTDGAGNLRNMSAILVDLVAKLDTYADNARKAALVASLGLTPEMLRAFNELGSSLQDTAAAQERTFTPEQYRRMKDAEKVAETLDNLYKALADTVGNVLSFAYRKWQEAVDTVMLALKPMFDAITALLSELAKPAPTTWFDALQQQGAGARDAIAGTRAEIARVEAQLRDLQARAPNSLFPLGPAIEETRTQLADLRAELARLVGGPSGTGWTARITVETTSGDDRDPNAPTEAEIRQREQLHETSLRQFDAWYAAGEAAARRLARVELNTFMTRQQGSGDVLNAMTYQYQSYADRVREAEERTREAYRGSGQENEQVARIKERLAKQEQANILETASMVASTITSLWPKSKAAAIGAAVINTGVAVTRALSGSIPPFNFIQAALVAAQGAAQIASIRSASATGGGTTAPVTGSGAGTSGNAAPAATQMLSISGLAPEGKYGGASVISLISEINDAVKNGATLISTSSARPRAQ